MNPHFRQLLDSLFVAVYAWALVTVIFAAAILISEYAG